MMEIGLKTETAGKPPLKDIPLFSELGTEELRLITSVSRVVKHRKNNIIFLSGDVYKGFYVVLKGTVKIYNVSKSGKETVLHIIKPFNVFADVPLFEGKNYPVNAQALDDALLLFIPKDEFIQILEQNVGICLKMLAGFAKRMKYLTRRVEEFTNKEVTSRLAEFLVVEIEKNKKPGLEKPVIRLQVSKATIASYLGTITETLSRSFRKLRDEEIIQIDGKKIIVCDYQRLRELASK